MKSAEQWLQEGYEKYKKGDLRGTLAALCNIRRKDSLELYAQAQVNLGVILGQQGDPDGAIAAYCNIQREDSPEQYTKAQFNLGVILGEQGDPDGAIAAYRNIRREDSKEVYAKAQVNLGVILGQRGDPDGKIAAYRNIRREDSAEQYAKAQFNLGVILGEQGDLDGAIAAYRNIRREDSAEQYTKAQINLGVILGEQDDLDGAIAAYRNIRREDSPEQYANAQVNLVAILGEQGNTNGAIEASRNIQRESSPEQYAKAQVNLGNTFKKQGDIEKAIAVYRNIQCEDSQEVYAWAQLNLGIVLSQRGDIDDEIRAYRNIVLKNLDYKDVVNIEYFDVESIIQILKCNEKYDKKLIEIKKEIINLTKKLLIFSKNEFELFESKVAHYTRGSTVWKMIGEQKPSAFRLNTIKNVNDPMEGLVLNRYLQKYCQLSNGLLFNSATENIEHQLGSVFISCFTFNHDSLNQFRLYGKEEEQEASGVSLVFSDEFFNLDQEDSLNFIVLSKNIEINDKHLSKQASPKNTEEPNNIKLLNKQPLYRCIYIDPDTGYLSLARRDEITFYRELLANDSTQDLGKLSADAQAKWDNYQKGILEKEKIVREHFKTISKHLQDLKAIVSEEGVSQEEKIKVSEALHFILLPLQYLVKHAAFQEEQECRIIYITELSDEKIQMDYGSKQMYVGYQPNVKENIDKIYLSPGAKAHEDFFRKVLNDAQPKKKVRISTNPFRNK